MIRIRKSTYVQWALCAASVALLRVTRDAWNPEFQKAFLDQGAWMLLVAWFSVVSIFATANCDDEEIRHLYPIRGLGMSTIWVLGMTVCFGLDIFGPLVRMFVD